ncbi:ATP-binding protein [Maricaulis sp. W15]|uniref:ATP-binding protein n=1 Tax=Maricaulis sp. W15 TaxID=1772333 RepID=UPI0018E9BC8A|nr:ATP-binding protein [Maricaulis sp. W15]
MDQDQFERLVRELRALPSETSWAEFKENNCDPQMIGDLIASLSNAATLEGKESAWIVWGVRDAAHELVGTSFVPGAAKKGNQDLESWLVQMLAPRINIQFHSGVIDGESVVVLQIPTARVQPTAFAGKELIRVGSTNRALRDVPEKERALWRCFDQTPFELQSALTDQSGASVAGLLDTAAFFGLQKLPVPDDQRAVLRALEEDRMVKPNDAGHWDITNLGAILFANDLSKFPTVNRKAVRLVVYGGKGRIKTEREHEGRRGYAIGFEALVGFLKALLPRNEVVGDAFREDVAMYPDLALRELIANALIHQDFTISGAGPMVEMFEDRVEITNPGEPLGDVRRLLDQAPRSRNEALAAFMRRIGLCEERGSGVDKVVFETEFYQLPPPRWEVSEGAFRAVLFAHKDFKDMDREERVHACYLHACLKHVQREAMTNTSLRKRFGIAQKNSAQASRIIREAQDAGAIKPYDPEQGNRNARYVPFWA